MKNRLLQGRRTVGTAGVIGAFGFCLAATTALAANVPSPKGVQINPGRCDDVKGSLGLFPFSDSLTTTDPTTAQRLNRGGVASTCTKPHPADAFAAPGRLHYREYLFKNRNRTAACVTVTVTQTSQVVNTSGEIQAAAYLGSFDPTDITKNFLGDIGVALKTGTPQSFSFNVPPAQNFDVVVNEFDPSGFGSFDLSVADCGTVVITGLNPAYSTPAGGITTEIDGFGFLTNPPLSGPPQVFFGQVPATNVRIDPNDETKLFVTVPPAPNGFSGAVPVTVRNADGSENTLDPGYTYYAPIPTSIGLKFAPAGPKFGDAVTITAQLTSAANPEIYSGTVTFVVDGTPTGAAVAADPGGKATAVVSNLSVGTHTVTAHYSGSPDMIYAAGDGSGQFSVQKATTTTALTIDNSPIAPTQNASFTAAVSSPSVGATRPTGSVVFTIDGAAQAPQAIDANGVARFTTAAPLGLGPHVIVATYVGDSNYAGSASKQGNQQVTANAATVSIVATPNPVGYGAEADFVVTVTGSGTPVGTVQLNVDGTDVGGAVPLVNGQATLPLTTLTGGSHTIKAVFTSGDINNSNGAGSVVENVTAAPTTTTVSVAPNPSTVGDSVTFKVTVTATPAITPVGIPHVPTGNVTISVNGTVVASVPLQPDGTVSVPKANFPAGTATVVAAYQGDAQKDFAPSTSDPTTLTVKPPVVDAGADASTGDAGNDAGLDASADAAGDASVPVDDGGGEVDATIGPEAGPVEAGPVPADDGGPATVPGVDAGGFLGGGGVAASSGCSCHEAGLPASGNVLLTGGVFIGLAFMMKRKKR